MLISYRLQGLYNWALNIFWIGLTFDALISSIQKDKSEQNGY